MERTNETTTLKPSVQETGMQKSCVVVTMFKITPRAESVGGYLWERVFLLPAVNERQELDVLAPPTVAQHFALSDEQGCPDALGEHPAMPLDDAVLEQECVQLKSLLSQRKSSGPLEGFLVTELKAETIQRLALDYYCERTFKNFENVKHYFRGFLSIRNGKIVVRAHSGDKGDEKKEAVVLALQMRPYKSNTSTGVDITPFISDWVENKSRRVPPVGIYT